METLIPYGFKEDSLPLIIKDVFVYVDREICICEYGFMYGAFDQITGGKICDLNITQHTRRRTEKEWIDFIQVYAIQILSTNHNWKEVLLSLPVLNQA